MTAKIHPPLLAGALLLVTLILHFLLPEEHAVEWNEVIGLLLVAMGAGMSSFAAAIFQARDTTRKPWGDPTQFVVMPPFTWTRNPMYLGLTLVLLGFAVFFSSITMLLAPLVFFGVIDRIVIPREEETMERLFGKDYVAYKERVRRWL
ncbi:MAG TPA: isoprenylcysteine carboxylmethyltransferase family protein [Candidatus Binatus sp.]|nr:isoprenylcysteine carboxylmethyltransferase family protein [Candidatus Binatus sp.]